MHLGKPPSQMRSPWPLWVGPPDGLRALVHKADLQLPSSRPSEVPVQHKPRGLALTEEVRLDVEARDEARDDALDDARDERRDAERLLAPIGAPQAGRAGGLALDGR